MVAPSWAASGTALSDTSATPAFAVPAGMVAGQVAVVCFFVNGATDQNVAPPDGTWEAAPDSPVQASNHWLYVYAHRAAGNESGTYTFTLDGSVFIEGQAHRYTDCVTTSSVFDSDTAAAVDNTGGTDSPAVTVTTGGANRLLLHAATNWSGGTWTASSGFTTRQQPPVGLSTLSDKTQAVAGSSGSVVAVSTNSDKRTAWLGALLPASSTVTGTAVATLGGLSGTAAAVRTVLATAASGLGALTGMAAAGRTVAGVAAGNLGSLTGGATALRTVTGAASGQLGGLTGTARGEGGTGQEGSAAGGWGSLLAITREARQIAQEEVARRPVACPRCGEPLRPGPRGELHCAFDSYITG